ncbi:inaD-like protein [Conger conger]|uniref:inaD-like protein n=1 Tax=Conger conger TaxID=82655 RepID=UPI002A5A0319|nr:inaD-like protein [Conger conger]
MERSLDKVERESSRVSLKRSAEVMVRSAVELADSGPGGARPQLAGDPDQASLTEWELRTKWEQALGPDYSVLVVGLDPVIEDDAELQKYSKLLPIHTMRLGVELDSFDGHHYISTVAPEGPVAKHGLLRPEDELLEVNGVQLYGKSRREAVAFLREVPPPFTLVCCRHLAEEGSEFLPREQEEQEDWHLQEQTRSNPPVLAERGSPWPGEVESSLVEVLLERATERQESPQLVEERSREEEEEEEEGEEEGELALWSPEVKVLELEKGEQGLGFSILDYQDPLDIARSVIVIRSLVPGGVAEAHGGVLPGDQLVFVNDTHLDTCHLPQAVEVLKAAPPGTVYLGIRKPLVTDESRGSGPVEVEAPREEAEVTEDTESLRETSPPVPESFADDPPSPREPSDEPEWILDGSFSLPRYASPSTAPHTPPGEREMAVDDEEVEEEEEEEQAKDSTSEEEEGDDDDDDDDDDEEGPSLYPERDTPVWDELEEAAPVAPPPGLAHLPQDLETIRPPLENRALLDLSTEMWRETGESDVDSDSRNGGSELTLTDTDTESIQSAAKEERKRRSQGAYRPAQRGGYRDLPEREEGEGEETPVFSHWGPPRRVEVWQDPEESLGISIVGGRAVIKRLKNGEELRGIFIKQVLPESPAGRTQALRTGDKILQVSGVDLTNASHEEAVEAIKGATSPVVFIVQSLSATPRPVSIMAPSLGKHKARRQGAQRGPAGGAPPPMRLPPPYRPPGGAAEEKVEEEEEEEEEEEQEEEQEELDEERIRQRYGDLPGELLLVELEKDRQGLGLSLAGNRDRSCVSIFVVGVTATGPAGRDGRVRIGDELLEINNHVLYGRSHQNASAIIKSAPAKVKLVLIRNEDAISQMAVPPFPAPPPPISSSESHQSVAPVLPPPDKPQPPDSLPLSRTLPESSLPLSRALPESSLPLGRNPPESSLPKEQAALASVEGESVESPLLESSLKSLSDGESVSKKLKSSERSVDSDSELVETPALEQSTVLSKISKSSSKLLSGDSDPAVSPPAPLPSSCTSPDFQHCSRDPATCPIVPGQETVIEISKGRSGLGLSIVGGKDTQLDAIVIHEVYEEGAAARDGRLWAGDQILEVNGVDLRSAAHEDAIAALRQTPPKVRLTVLRDESQYRDEENLDVFRVELQKKSGRGLGLSIVGKR